MSGDHKNEAHPAHFALLMLGGLCLGTGLLNLYYSFGWPGGDLNSNFTLIGFSALDEISMLPDAQLSIPMVVVGALCMIFANATAWRHTDGY